jgi:hypothetical protein
VDQTQIEQIASSQLDGGERLLWSGAPAPGKAALGALPALLLAIPFTGFAVFWIWGAAQTASKAPQHDGPWAFFPLFGLPFLLVGLGMLLAPLWAFLGAMKTVYALTDRRAIIISGLGRRGVRSFTSADIGDVMRVEGSDGRGTVFFASRSVVNSKGFERPSRIGFVGIPDVRRVEELIREHLQRSAA